MEKMLKARYWEGYKASILRNYPTSHKSLCDPQFKIFMNTEPKYYGKRCSPCLITRDILRGFRAINVALLILSNFSTMLGSGYITVDKREKGPFLNGD